MPFACAKPAEQKDSGAIRARCLSTAGFREKTMAHRRLYTHPRTVLVTALALGCAVATTGLRESPAGPFQQTFVCPSVQSIDCCAVGRDVPDTLSPTPDPGPDSGTATNSSGIAGDPSISGAGVPYYGGGPGQQISGGGAASFQSVGAIGSNSFGNRRRSFSSGLGLGSGGGGGGGGSLGGGSGPNFGANGGVFISGTGAGVGAGSPGSSGGSDGGSSGSSGSAGSGAPGGGGAPGSGDPGGAGDPSDPGSPIGTGSSNPIPPLPGTTYLFQYAVTSGGAGDTSPLFFDPPTASAYDFRILSGPNFASVEVPGPLSGTGQTQFILFFGSHTDTLTAGIPFLFTSVDPGGVSEFEIAGILSGGTVGSATFDTAITFVDAGDGTFLQTPIFPSPEPGSLTLCGLAATALLACQRSRRNKSTTGVGR